MVKASFVFMILICLSGQYGHASMLDGFQLRTPSENRLTYTGSGLIQFDFIDSGNDSYHNGAYRPAFRKFYFYKDHVVAQSDSLFYVIDENEPSVKRFSEEADFERYLEQQGLKPELWTRWYDRHYRVANFGWLRFFARVMFPLTLLLAGLYLYSCYSLLVNKTKHFRRLKQIYTISVTLFLILVVLMQSFPQSI